MAGLTYREAGVDIEAGDRLIDRIKPLAARTRTPNVLSSVGGFAGLCGLPDDIEDPVLVSGTDGVGTKLKLAFEMDAHATVGIDLVAMCVNDIITTGARPLFFLDYFATGRLDVDRGAAVVEGIAQGCELSKCALLGGETAELPGFYADGEYDLAGFAVGVVSKKAILDGSKVSEGDVVLGVASTGLHSNGYSLARKALLEVGGQDLRAPFGGDGPDASATLGEVLLRPTRIYVEAAAAALAAGSVHAFCHITGGGLPGNLPRVLPEGLGADLDPTAWQRPTIFDRVQSAGGVDEAEMYRTFNMGLGFIVVCSADSADDVLAALAGTGEAASRVGVVRDASDGDRIRIG